MRNVLLISYYFPPMGGAGVQRSAKFVKYLPQFGWRPIVLTVRAEDYELRREFQRDNTLSAEVEGRAEVHRTRDWAPRRLRRLLERLHLFRLFWFLFYPVLWEKEFFWALGAMPEALKILRQKRPAAIYTSSAPYSLIVAGFLLRLWTRVPWAADLRDLWTQDPLWTWPSRLHYRLTAAAERLMLRHADVVIANTPLAAKLMEDFLGRRRRGPVVTVPNGYDAGDMPLISQAPKVPISQSPLVITHVGTFHNLRPENNGTTRPGLLRRLAQRMEYRPCPLDPGVRTPSALLKGLGLLYEHHPELRGRIRLCFVGFLHEGWRRMIHDLDLADFVDAPGYLPHPEAVARLMEADLLYCVQVGFRDKKKPVPYVPAKLYEYLATGKPILAPVAPGDTPDILSKAGTGIFTEATNPLAMSRVLRELVEHCPRTGNCAHPNWEFIRRFERKELTRELAGLFAKVTVQK
jgi:glycosyltransferase involved in cell wall biosynthesis